MSANVKFTSVPVGEKFMYKGEEYTRFTHKRGKQVVGGQVILVKFPKDRIVTWINNY